MSGKSYTNTLELCPDLYQVRLPGTGKPGLWQLNPELHIQTLIDQLLDGSQTDGARLFHKIDRETIHLEEETSLLDKRVIPNLEKPPLLLLRRPRPYLYVLLLLTGVSLCGYGLGRVLSSLMAVFHSS